MERYISEQEAQEFIREHPEGAQVLVQYCCGWCLGDDFIWTEFLHYKDYSCNIIKTYKPFDEVTRYCDGCSRRRSMTIKRVFVNHMLVKFEGEDEL